MRIILGFTIALLASSCTDTTSSDAILFSSIDATVEPNPVDATSSDHKQRVPRARGVAESSRMLRDGRCVRQPDV